MKKVLGISLTSSERDHKAVISLGGKKISVQRIGTDGSFEKARKLFLQYDKKVDAFGLGGIDLTLGIGKHGYRVKDAYNLIKGLKTPVFDGNGIKHILDKNAIDYLTKHLSINLKDKKVFMVCASNRSGMAEYFEKQKCNMVYGDFMFGFKLPIPIHSLKVGSILARIALPIATRLPHKFLYPIEKSQKKRKPKFTRYFEWADIIAGDFHYIYKYSPDNLKGKIIITTTTTNKDIQEMKEKGAKYVITTTPDLGGRSLASNIIEATLYVIKIKGNDKRIIPKLVLKPTVKCFY